MTKPAHDIDALRDATDRLVDATAKLAGLTEREAGDASAVTQPSLLPDWTRGHVLTHLSRNADALVNVVRGLPMYASAEIRDADINEGGGRGLVEQVEDLRTSSARLDAELAALTDAQWDSTVELRNGITDSASRLPFRRLVEVELHHVDLGIGYTLDELPGAFTDKAIDYLTKRFAARTDVPALELRAEDGRSWTTGGQVTPAGGPQVVVGTPNALVGWLAGRSTGSGLTANSALPVLPTL